MMKKLSVLGLVLLALAIVVGCAGMSRRGQDQQTEIVIIGAGGAGFAAGLEAVQAGRSVIIIEKNQFTGGNTATAGSAMNAANPELIKSLNLQITQGEIDFIERLSDPARVPPRNAIMARWQDTVRAEWAAHRVANPGLLFDSPSWHSLTTYYGGDFVAKPELVDILGQRALETNRWLASLGGGWLTDRLPAAVGATWRRSHTPDFSWGGSGANFFMPVEAAFEKAGGQVLIGYKADTIIMENGRAVGVSGVTDSGTPFSIRASRAVMLATGGFGANYEMLERHNRYWPGFTGVATSNLPSATGDGHVMGARAGANLIDMEWIQMVSGMGSIMEGSAITNLVLVNRNGERFIGEDERRDRISGAVISQPGAFAWGIQDGHSIDLLLNDSVVFGGTHGRSIREMATTNMNSANPTMFIADTIQELAALIGVPYATLQAQINAFNAAATGAASDPMGRQVFQYPINRPPFLANRARAVIHHTMGGVEINVNAEVLSVAGAVIPGLYAAGEVAGGVHGSNRLGANAIPDILIFGRIAGQNMAR